MVNFTRWTVLIFWESYCRNQFPTDNDHCRDNIDYTISILQDSTEKIAFNNECSGFQTVLCTLEAYKRLQDSLLVPSDQVHCCVILFANFDHIYKGPYL